MVHIVFRSPFLGRLGLMILLAASLTGCQTTGKTADTATGADMVRLADRLRGQGDVRAAVEFYLKAAEHAPDDAAPRLALADIFAQQGMMAEAADMYGEAIRRAPKDGEARRAYARLLIQMERPQDAARQYEAILDEDSRDAKALSGYGVALDLQGKHEEAQKNYRAALQRAPDSAHVVNNLGYSLILSDKPAEAAKILAPFAEGPKSTPSLRQKLAMAQALAGRDDEARRILAKDFQVEEVEQKLATWRTQRAATAPKTPPQLSADLGTFPTAAMAEAQHMRLRARVAGEFAETLRLESSPELGEGETARFRLRALGFGKEEEVTEFCRKVMKAGLNCAAVP